MSSSFVPAPRLPTPPNDYLPEYFNQLVRSLNAYFVQLQNPGPVQATTYNASLFDPQTGARTLGMVFSTNLSSNLISGATSMNLNDVTGFSATGGYGMVTNATVFVKFKYTGKSVTTGAGSITGITYISSPHAFNNGHVVTASALTGDMYYDPLAGYGVYVIPN
jgi:hypothetical protein